MGSIKTPFPKFSHKKTTCSEEEVIKRAGQFFADNGWLIQDQAESEATFKGRPPIPLRLLFLTIVGFLFFIIPGVIVYRVLVKRAVRLQNIGLVRPCRECGGNYYLFQGRRKTNK